MSILPRGAVPFANGVTLPAKVQEDLLETQRWVYSYTVPILLDCEDRDKKMRVGTGIVIEIGDRTFVASAGHVVKERPHVLFGANPRLHVPCLPTAFLNREFRDPPDVGFLEVRKGSHHKTCFFESLTDSPPPAETLMLLVGHPINSPGSLNDPAWKGGNYFELVRETHGASIKEAHEDRYVFPYPEDLLNLNPATGHLSDSKGYVSPEGFSGGGVWCKRTPEVAKGLLAEKEVINPGNMLRLYAIDYSWLDLSRKVNCVPIRYWVKLVYDSYPDLREIIERQFPKIKEVQL